ncbi:MAG: Ribosomal RNA small subunit methyltransferase A [Phycisphaerales bacterium]|nr:Ribosomal RNA small subunit methyltransferase A [Phycisphaerales bacterium]
MQSLAQIKRHLDERGLAPRHRLGQNFLIDHNLIRKLVDAAGVGPGSLVLEVGPGTGTMTEELLERGCRVVACELDAGLAALLRDVIGHGPHADRFTLVEGDCLETKRRVSGAVLRELVGRPFKLVSNLPYAAATPLITTLLASHAECPLLAVTIQREVGDRLAAGPGSKDYGPLSVIAQSMATIEPVATLPPECFWPRPDVTSAMVLLRRRERPLTDDVAGLAQTCQRLFAQRRKQIRWFLGKNAAWPAGIEPHMRAEELTPEQLIVLSKLAKPAPDEAD